MEQNPCGLCIALRYAIPLSLCIWAGIFYVFRAVFL